MAPVQEKIRANISIIDDKEPDYTNLLKLKHKLEKKQNKILTLVEVVRIAVSQAIDNN